jgi:hypothetical protein
LKEPEVRKALTKLAFADEWATSLRESHPDSKARSLALDTFEAEVSLLRREIGKALPGFDAFEGSKDAGFSWV